MRELISVLKQTWKHCTDVKFRNDAHKEICFLWNY